MFRNPYSKLTRVHGPLIRSSPFFLITSEGALTAAAMALGIMMGITDGVLSNGCLYSSVYYFYIVGAARMRAFLTLSSIPDGLAA